MNIPNGDDGTASRLTRPLELGFFAIRSALFVPGNRPDRVEKALASGADLVVVDLEDAVPFSQKQEARGMVKAKILEHRGQRLCVRVNSTGSGLITQDLQSIVVKGLQLIMLPKVEGPADLLQVNRHLLEMEKNAHMSPGSIRTIALIESALGIEKIFDIASTRGEPQRLLTMAFGAADFTLDLGIDMTPEATELLFPRARMAIACRAAGLAPPIDSPYMIDIRDTEGLVADATMAKSLGFQGKLCVHPAQVSPCNAVFSPSERELDHAVRIIDAYEQTLSEGHSVVELDGKFIDPPVVERAKRTLLLAKAIGINKK